MDLQIEYININEIKPYKGNAKEHPKKQIEQIKKSIQEFGFADPLGIWNGEIVEGHGRYLAAKELKMEQVPVIRLDELTDEQRRAYGLVHNQLTMNTPFNLDALKIELDNIGEIDLSDMGFDLSSPGDMSNYPEVDINDDYCLKVECDNEKQLEELYERLQGEGYRCRVSTL